LKAVTILFLPRGGLGGCGLVHGPRTILEPNAAMLFAIFPPPEECGLRVTRYHYDYYYSGTIIGDLKNAN